MTDRKQKKEPDELWFQAGLFAVVLICIAITGAAIELKWSLSGLAQAYKENSAQIDAEAKETIEQSCILKPSPAKEECVADTHKAAQDAKRDEADLYAQRKMAEWAFAVGITAFISVCLSLVGIFFVWRSLALNRQAIATAERAIVEQDRPYLFVEFVTFINPLFEDIGDGLKIRQHSEINFKVANYTDVPALIKGHHAQVEINTIVAKAVALLPDDTHAAEKMVKGNGSGILWAMNRRAITDEQAAEIHSGGHVFNDFKALKIFLFGYIRYENPFGIVDEVGFCWEYDVFRKQFLQSDNADWNYRKRNIGKDEPPHGGTA